MDEYESLSHAKWSANITWSSSRSAAGRHCTGRYESTWEKCSESWPSRRNAGSRKGICCQTTCTSLIAVPPKYAVSQVVGFIKGKSAIHLARVYGERKQNFVGWHLWARGYFVSTVGRDEKVIREYIRNQGEEDERLDQMNLWRRRPPSGGHNNRGRDSYPAWPLRAAHIVIPPALPGDI